MMMSSIMMAKTTGTSLSQGGSGVMNGVAALKASATATTDRHALREEEPRAARPETRRVSERVCK
jgi:hypothetical protein